MSCYKQHYEYVFDTPDINPLPNGASISWHDNTKPQMKGVEKSIKGLFPDFSITFLCDE